MSVPALHGRPSNKDFVATRAVNDKMLDTLGTITLTLRLGSRTWQHVFHVLRDAAQAILLGWDFLCKNHTLINVATVGHQCPPTDW